MKQLNYLYFLLCLVFGFMITSCGVCDPRSSDYFSFYITDSNNNDIYTDTSYHKNQLKLTDINGNHVFLDTLITTTSVKNIFSSNLNYHNEKKYILHINDTLILDVIFQSSFHKARCGDYYTIDNITYENITASRDVYLNAYKIKIN